ncbi:MAG: VCBS repeat-containing protein, partial [Acidobacteria bacterium]|nr:VCBS repeat-containing protein [Acidobacteriota bacterium]
SAQTLKFTQSSQAGINSRWHADLNKDGLEDQVLGTHDGFAVQLSTGNGTYAPAVDYALPDGPAVDLAIGNFLSSSGDIVVVNGSKNIYVFLNHGNGTYQLQPVISAADGVWSVVAGDFNHDGNMDIAYGTLSNNQIHVLFGPIRNGAFAVGPVTTVPDAGTLPSGAGLTVGDFDGDGKADLLAQSCTPNCQAHVYYGDGTGHFPTQVGAGSGVPLGHLRVFDLNGDAKSDLVGLPFTENSVGGFTLYKYIQVFYGNSARTWSETRIAARACTAGEQHDNLTVADFNGDGIPDLAFEEAATCNNPTSLQVITGKGAGAFNPEQTLFQSALLFFRPEAIRAALNTRPDLELTSCTSSGCQAFNIDVFLNMTSAAFPSCNPPNGFIGITVCGPAPGSTVSSPVSFHVGAAGQTNMRKVEVWVDGHKLGEQFTHAFSKYAFFDRSFPLAAGGHNVTVFAAGWDNWLEKSSFRINVK